MDTLDSKGRGALHHAARYGSLDCLAVLAQHHADAFRPDADGRTPLDVAEDCARSEAAALLRKCARPLQLLGVWGLGFLGWQPPAPRPSRSDALCVRGCAHAYRLDREAGACPGCRAKAVLRALAR